jgi:hypothetical protein
MPDAPKTTEWRGTVTREMIQAGHEVCRQAGLSDASIDLEAIYRAMRALEPTYDIRRKSEKPGAHTMTAMHYCTFCSKSQHAVRKLIAGPNIFICSECVDLCADIIGGEPAISP